MSDPPLKTRPSRRSSRSAGPRDGGITTGSPPAAATAWAYPAGTIMVGMSRQWAKLAGTSYAVMPISGRLRCIPPQYMNGRNPRRRAAVTLDELRAEVEAGRIDTVLLVMTDMQGRLMGKRLHAPCFLSDIAEHGAEGCYYLLTVDVDMATVQGFSMGSWDTGYGDFVFRPDMATLRRVPWLEATALVVADLEWQDGRPVVASPRQILRRQLERLAERGWTANVGSELEFMLFRDSYDEARAKRYHGLTGANPY